MTNTSAVSDKFDDPRLDQYCRIVLRENANLNLTGDDTPQLFRARHLEDGVRGCRALLEASITPHAGQRGLDVGSGAGLPGIVFAILWPQVQWTLLDARRKRTDFLTALVEEMKLPNVEVLNGRVESLAHEPSLRGQFDFVLARALAPLPALAELTLPFARLGGGVVAFKTHPIDEEIRQAQFAISAMGGDPANLRELPYIRSDGKSCQIVFVSKTTATPRQFPRRDGLPAKKPLISSGD